MFQKAILFVNYQQKEFRIGTGKYGFRTRWSASDDSCVRLYSDQVAGIANTELTDFAVINRRYSIRHVLTG